VTAARRYLDGQTYLVTRRCARRCFFLKPTRRALAIMRYCLAYVASRYSVEIHAVVFNSSHVHYVLTDPHCELARFMQHLDGLMARAMNAHLGRGECFWGGTRSFSKVALHGREKILEKLVYTILNVVKDGLVRRPEQWPGIVSTARDPGRRVFKALRPDFFFRSEGTAEKPPLPAEASFRFEVPPGFEDLGDEGFRDLLEARVGAELRRIHAERKAAGKTRFMGRRAVLAQSPYDSAGDVFPTRGLDPTLAHDPEERAAVRGALREWRAEYRAALARYLAGNRRVVFPVGTYLMRVRFHVRTGTSPPRNAAA